MKTRPILRLLATGLCASSLAACGDDGGTGVSGVTAGQTEGTTTTGDGTTTTTGTTTGVTNDRAADHGHERRCSDPGDDRSTGARHHRRSIDPGTRRWA